MELAIYSEFPEKSLENLANIESSIDVMLASKNLKQFEELKKQVEKYNSVRKIGYWPLLERKEGYWLSPFSKKEALERVISELKNRDNTEELSIIWDAELPYLYKRQIVRESFTSNKDIITNLLEDHKKYNLEISIAEYPTFVIPEGIQRWLGIAFDPKKYDINKNKMIYTSTSNIAKKLFRKEIKKGLKKYSNNFSISIGCLNTGALGNEPVMSPMELQRDLEIAKEEGVSKIYIYGLAGINEETAEVLRKFS